MAKKQSKPSVNQSHTSAVTGDELLNRAERISNIVGALSQFIPINYTCAFENRPLFSREFLLKNLLGLSDEEYLLNDELILNEQTDMIKAMDMANQYNKLLEAQAIEETVEPKKKTKKKEMVN